MTIPHEKKILVIGGGIAGASVAYACARRGHRVHVFESESSCAQKASRNPAAIAYPLMTAEKTVLSDITWRGFHFIRDILNREQPPIPWKNSGVLHIHREKDLADRHRRSLQEHKLPEEEVRWVSCEQASELAGIPLQDSALHFPHGLWISLHELTRWMLDSSRLIETHFDSRIRQIEKHQDSWRIKNAEGSILASGDVLVLANAHDALEFGTWPLRKVRGQLATINSSTRLQQLKSVLVFEHFVTPGLPSGEHLVGATFDRTDLSLEIRHNDNERLIESLKNNLSALKDDELATRWTWAELRTSCPGQEPLIGEIDENLYAFLALGSRGSIFGPWGGECIASAIDRDPSFFPEPLRNRLSPHRFR